MEKRFNLFFCCCGTAQFNFIKCYLVLEIIICILTIPINFISLILASVGLHKLKKYKDCNRDILKCFSVYKLILTILDFIFWIGMFFLFINVNIFLKIINYDNNKDIEMIKKMINFYFYYAYLPFVFISLFKDILNINFFNSVFYKKKGLNMPLNNNQNKNLWSPNYEYKNNHNKQVNYNNNPTNNQVNFNNKPFNNQGNHNNNQINNQANFNNNQINNQANFNNNQINNQANCNNNQINNQANFNNNNKLNNQNNQDIKGDYNNNYNINDSDFNEYYNLNN